MLLEKLNIKNSLLEELLISGTLEYEVKGNYVVFTFLGGKEWIEISFSSRVYKNFLNKKSIKAKAKFSGRV